MPHRPTIGTSALAICHRPSPNGLAAYGVIPMFISSDRERIRTADAWMPPTIKVFSASARPGAAVIEADRATCATMTAPVGVVVALVRDRPAATAKTSGRMTTSDQRYVQFIICSYSE